MNWENVKRGLQRHAGMLAGALLGILSGLHIFGLAIGTLIGYFLDEILHDRRILKNGTDFIEHPERGVLDDRWARFVSGSILIDSLGMKQGLQSAEDGTIGHIEREMLVGRVAESFGLVGREAGLLKQLVIRTKPDNSAPAEQFSALYKSVSTPEQRLDLVRMLLTMRPDQDSEIKDISLILEIAPDQYNEIRIDTIDIDTGAYEILGVDPKAGDHEIRKIYRQLASQFHPDTGSCLEAHQQAQSREAFIKIQNAYNRICKERNGLRPDQFDDTPKEN